jgi:hypothetical protein
VAHLAERVDFAREMVVDRERRVDRETAVLEAQDRRTPRHAHSPR